MCFHLIICKVLQIHVQSFYFSHVFALTVRCMNFQSVLFYECYHSCISFDIFYILQPRTILWKRIEGQQQFKLSEPLLIHSLLYLQDNDILYSIIGFHHKLMPFIPFTSMFSDELVIKTFIGENVLNICEIHLQRQYIFHKFLFKITLGYMSLNSFGFNMLMILM